ncbi:AvrD family protein [Plantactinospora sp. KBS50]|uniref:AvrD family protein n=1 Tax=Plantactinospora sp. KBS50 TaxID=2024580 RepID=UPI000BAB19CD|nr:AvrD family protein [Plantactinospora sp. KBS50]ASW53295.1 hypothetical protein CIK06_02505 [Plantactinospora sp. KBS50]
MTRLRAPRSIDDYLGPGEDRFFGGGYRRVSQHLEALTLVSDGTAVTAAGTARVRYPPDWSRKSAGRVLRPHLSSVDALVLAVALAEAGLTRAHGFGPRQRGRSWLRAVTMRAGRQPDEALAGIPVSAVVAPSGAAARLPGFAVSAADCTIGGIRIRCEVEHPAGAGAAGIGAAGIGPLGHRAVRRAGGEPASTAPRAYRSVDDLIGPAADRYYGEGLRHRTQLVEQVAVDLPAQRVGAAVRIRPEPGRPAPSDGVEAAYQPAATMLDCMTSIAQLAQVLMYELDGLGRQASNTLWMRRVALRRDRPDQPLPDLIGATTSATNSRLVPLADTVWRVCDLVCTFDGIEAEYSIAHQLPKESRPS